ncbi:HET domain-containing protein [Nemania sp. NC0429]|nr:HET domain-containing protein [Nemania sp. NC0429]
MSNHPDSSDPCYCGFLHRKCNPATCSQAARASESPLRASLRDLRKSGESGCTTCAIVFDALSTPNIRDIWQESIEPALRAQRSGVVNEMRIDEEAIGVEFNPTNMGNERRVLRTRASEVSDDWRHFNVWRERNPGKCLESHQNERCRAFPPLNHHPVEHTDSEASMEHLKDWIRNCTKRHTCYTSDDPVLPTRLVQVVDGQVRVVNTEGRRGRYMTLSHKWGTNEGFKLTKSNITDLTSFIPWDDIPKAYQQSIEVTRRLGIEHIWIDSLCIIQDDTEDWKREAGKMKEVYGSSYLNIAAVQAADSHGSLFASSTLGAEYPARKISRDPSIQIRPQPHLTHRYFGSNYYQTSRHPLLQRGWVLQERILAPRVVYYDAAELKWECQAMTDCQCGGMAVISNFKQDYHRFLADRETPLAYMWMRISEKYSSLEFTYNSDRLVALAGIAEQGVQSGKGGRYLAGHWEHGLAHQLCWGVHSTYKRPEAYLAPSWSWLSVFGSVVYPNRMDFRGAWSRIDVEITEVSCTTAEGAILTTSSSPIWGFIRLKGRGLNMRAELTSLGSESRPPVYGLRREGGDGEEPSISVQADYVMSREEASAIGRVFLLFWGDIWTEPTFLVLRPVSADSFRFERLGILRLSKGDKAKDREKILAYCTTENDIVVV